MYLHVHVPTCITNSINRFPIKLKTSAQNFKKDSTYHARWHRIIVNTVCVCMFTDTEFLLFSGNYLLLTLLIL